MVAIGIGVINDEYLGKKKGREVGEGNERLARRTCGERWMRLLYGYNVSREAR